MDRIAIIKNFFTKAKIVLSERNLFIIAALLNLLPIFLVRHVGSLDGPQHLYISQVIAELWKGNALYTDFYQFSSLVIGNSTANLILAIFNFFLPAWLAEKILLTAILLGMAFSFRYLIIQLAGKSSLISFVIFPFSYHMFFMQGYYNYSLAYVFLFATSSWWLIIKEKLNPYRFVALTALLLLTYYTHIFIFGLLLFLLAVMAVSSLIRIFLLKTERKEAGKNFLKQHLLLALAALPGMVLGFFYFKIIPESQYAAAQQFAVLDNLYRMQFLIGYITDAEMVYTRLFGLTLAILTFYALLSELISGFSNKSGKGFWQRKSSPFLLAAIMMLVVVLFFTELLPGASMLPRIILSFLFFLMVWLAALSWPKWLQFATFVAVVVLSAQLRLQQQSIRSQLSADIEELLEVEDYIPKNTVFLSLNFSSNWIHHHFKNYLGSNKTIVNLHTDAVTPYFIVDWNREKMPDLFIGKQAVQRFNDYSKPFVSDTAIIAKYIAVWGFKTFNRESFDDLFKQSITEDYESLYTTSKGNGALFRYKE